MPTHVLLAAMLAAAQPDPDAFVRLDCPWIPIFFESGETGIPERMPSAFGSGSTLGWFPAPDDAVRYRVLLTATSREGEPGDRVALSEARADAVRALLIERGMAPDHIYIAYDFGEGPNFGREGWVGGWVYPSIFVTRAERERLFPPGGPVC